MKSLKAFTFLFSLLLLFAACGKETVLTKTDLLTDGSAKKWEILIHNVNPPVVINGEAYTSVFQWNDVCFSDNTQEFNANGSYAIEDTNKKCSGDISDRGSWRFNEFETNVIMTDSDGETTEFGLIELNADKFEIGHTLYINGKPHYFTRTYFRKN